MSTRISKQSVEQIAQALTKPLVEQASAAHKRYQEAVTAAYEATIPAAVQELSKKHVGFLKMVSSIRLNGNGFNREVVSATRRVVSHDDSYTTNYEPTAPIAKTLQAAAREYDKQKGHAEKVYRETVTALVNLRTYKNISEQLPEALPFLPPSVSTAIVLNLSGLRQELQMIKTA